MLVVFVVRCCDIPPRRVASLVCCLLIFFVACRTAGWEGTQRSGVRCRGFSSYQDPIPGRGSGHPRVKTWFSECLGLEWLLMNLFGAVICNFMAVCLSAGSVVYSENMIPSAVNSSRSRKTLTCKIHVVTLFFGEVLLLVRGGSFFSFSCGGPIALRREVFCLTYC